MACIFAPPPAVAQLRLVRPLTPSLMRPETIPELIVSIVLGVIAVGSAIALKLQAVTHTTFFAIVASSTSAAGVFFAVRHYLRSQPRFLDIKAEDWKEVRTPVESSEDVRVTIPAKTHK